MKFSEPIQVAIVVVCYNGREYLRGCLESLFASNAAGTDETVIVVDNASTDGSRDLIRERFPQAVLIESEVNCGYGGGANLGWRHVRQNLTGVEFLCVVNQDLVVETGWLRTLVDFLRTHPPAGIAQPKVRLFPETDRINTAGNRCHYLGFGFPTGCGEVDRGQSDEPRQIDFASGAALIIRREAIERTAGFTQGEVFNADLFLYLEDQELSWQVRAVGYEVWCVPQSAVYHASTGDAWRRHYELLERNRWILLLSWYRLRTLLLLAPALALMEVCQFVFSITHGLVRQRWRAYGWFWRPTNIRRLFARRRRIQRSRRISDRQLIGRCTGSFAEAPIGSSWARRAAGVLFGGYWAAVRHVIRW